MLTHSKIHIIRLVFALLFSLSAVFVKAQVTQTVSVLPPYSNKLSDYIASPGKIIDVINAPHGYDGVTLEFYVHGSIISSDESVVIRTKEGFKPTKPLTIKPVGSPAASIFLPYTLTYNDILQIFSEQNIVYKGITKQEVVQNGLPEGTYSICFDIIGYKYGNNISSQCSNTFSVRSVEAPEIISPINNTFLRNAEAKNVVFTWTRPVNAPFSTQYKLKIIELINLNDNYHDRIRSAGYPTFFETTVSGNAYLYSAANPPLKEGKTYAFMVSAIDPSGKTAFRNKGFSEVNIFTYQQEEQKVMSGTVPGGINTESPKITVNKDIIPSMLSTAVLKGTLKYAYHSGENKKSYPLAKAKIKLVTHYIVKYADGKINESRSRGAHSCSSAYKNGQDVAFTTTNDLGQFTFTFLSGNNGEPLPCDPGCENKIAQTDVHQSEPEVAFANLLAVRQSGGPNPGEMLLESPVPADNSCKLYTGYTIEIEGEHGRYYLHPDQDVNYFFEVKGGETKDVGEIISLVKTIDLNVKVTSTSDNAKFTVNDKKELANMNVFLFRKVNFDYPAIFPAEDVTPEKTDIFPAPVAGMVCVGKGLTNKEGVAKISAIVFNDNTTYQYYVYVNNSQNYNYESDAPVRIDFKELGKVPASQSSGSGSNNVIIGSNYSYDQILKEHSASKLFFNDIYDISKGLDYSVVLSLRYPTLQIILQETDGLKKIEQTAQVILEEKYHAGNQKFDLSNDVSPLKSDLTLYTPMALKDKGTYELNNLGNEITVYPQNLVGPNRKVYVKSEGFADTTFTVKNGNPLKMGERYTMYITLRYGGVFAGQVIDGDTQEPLPNTCIKILGESSKVSTTNNDGSYYMETRKLSGVRKVEISRVGYITDTVEVKLNKDKNYYYFELYRKSRKLRVIVWGKNDYQEGVVVTLPDVPKSWQTNFNKQSATINSYAGLGSNLTITKGTVAAKMGMNGTKTPATPKNTGKTTKATKASVSKSVGNSPSVVQIPILTGQSNNTEPYSLTTDNDGIVDFAFEGGQSNRFKLVISNSSNSNENFPAIIREVEIPYLKDYMGSVLQITLDEGGCLSGTAYLGETNNKALEGMDVIATISGQSEEYKIQTKTDASGKYILRNLPVNQSFKLQVSSGKTGDNIVGYNNDQYKLLKGGAACQNEDFHFKAIDGVDVSSFLGFPFSASNYSPTDNLLSGTITLPANNYFGEEKIDIKDVKMVKSEVKNSNGDALLVPQTLPFVTDKNNIVVTLPGDYKAVITDNSGLKIDLFESNKAKGQIKANVLINSVIGNSTNGNFGGYGYSLPNVYLTIAPGVKQTAIPVYCSAQEISSANIGKNGFYLSDGKNESLTYSIDGFDNKAIAQADKSFFDLNGLSLQTKLKVAIANLNPSNIELDAGLINISKQGIKTVDQKPFAVNLGKWKLQCNTWSVSKEGVKVSNAVLSTGVDVKIENLEFTSNLLVTDKATVHLENVKLLGVKDLIINTTKKGLVYKYLHDGVSGWSLYATPDAGKTCVATLQGLPGVNPTDKIEFLTVDFNSEGESTLALNSKKFRLYNIVDFTPYPSTLMYVTPTSLKLMGTYDFGIPEYVKPSGAMGFFREGNNIAFDMMDMDAFSFTHHNVHYKLTDDYVLSDNLFTAKGFVEEPGNLPPIKVTMFHTLNNTKIDINKGEKLPMGTGKELANLVGGIKVVNNQWDTFRFEGEVKGLSNMASNQKMNFEVKGAVQATGQQIAVSDIPSFPGLSITYDMPNSRFIGSASLNMDLSGFQMQGNVNTIMDSQGWLFNASGMLEVPGVGSANFYGLFGNYMNMPPEVSAKIGNAVCLPNSFKTNLKGFFLSAGLTKQILPKIDYNYGIVSIQAGVDVSVNARTYMIFGQGTTFGLGVLAEGHAYLGGECSVTCTSANADAKLQLGISGDYNSKSHFYNIDGCTSLSLKISAEQCVPVLIDCGPCVSVTLADFTIGAKVHLDNTNGFSMGLTTSSCDQQCK